MPKFNKISRNEARLNRKIRQNKPFPRNFANKQVPTASSRKEPITPQAIIIATCSINPDERARREGSVKHLSTSNIDALHNLYAPLGVSADAFSVVGGECVYRLCGSPLMRRVSHLMSETEVFSCVNGLPRNVHIEFVGVAQISKTNGHRNANDTQISVITGGKSCVCVRVRVSLPCHSFFLVCLGTATIFNTGGFALPANKVICFSEMPHVSVHPVTGVMTNLVNEIGIPRDKFRPAIFAIDHTEVSTCTSHALMLGGGAKTTFIKAITGGARPSDAFALGIKYNKKHSEEYLGQNYEFQPFASLPYVVFASFVLRTMWAQKHTDAARMTVTCRDTLIKWCEHSEVSLGNTNTIGSGATPSPVLDLKYNPANSLMQNIAVLDITLSALVPYIQNQQSRWLERHKIGTTITAGNANGPVDIMVRRY